jgi:hypothetical protein
MQPIFGDSETESKYQNVDEKTTDTNNSSKVEEKTSDHINKDKKKDEKKDDKKKDNDDFIPEKESS